MQVRGVDVLGAPRGTWTPHVMLFRPVRMECRDDELVPKVTDFVEQPRLVILLLRSLRGR